MLPLAASALTRWYIGTNTRFSAYIRAVPAESQAATISSA